MKTLFRKCWKKGEAKRLERLILGFVLEAQGERSKEDEKLGQEDMDNPG